MLRAGKTVHYDGPSGGWGSLRESPRFMAANLAHRPSLTPYGGRTNGFACVSCAWAKPANYHPTEFCENGAKATLWEQTSQRCTSDFFAKHALASLREWRDYDLEQQGRLTHPLRYDGASGRYIACSWDEAFAAVGEALKGFNPKSVVLYSSGRASLEASYCYSLFARLYGTNNLPDSSNMCHETTSVALKKLIGVGVGTTVYEDFFRGHRVRQLLPRLTLFRRDPRQDTGAGGSGRNRQVAGPGHGHGPRPCRGGDGGRLRQQP
jgi:anaerobic selenocysteine-containing dehydrogenase